LSILSTANRPIFHISAIPAPSPFVYDSTVASFANKEHLLWQER
jgi:hypothetical protein